MGSKEQSLALVVVLIVAAMLLQCTESLVPFGANYGASTDATHTRVQAGGDHVDLVLDATSAAAFASKNKYLFGSIGMGTKLVPGNSAGTVTAYYLSSEGGQSARSVHDEMDFEFLGNSSGQPYILQTNVFAQGKGDREQKITLWFDPTAEYHSYSLLWNKNIIVFYVDTVPIRVFKNNEAKDVPFPNNQGVGIYASLWDGSAWATQGGSVPLDWKAAPFVASFKGFGVDACAVGNSVAACTAGNGNWWDSEQYQDLNANQIRQLKNIRQKYVLYDYCTDTERNLVTTECASNWYE